MSYKKKRQTHSFATVFNFKKNNFGFLRLFLAFSVLYQHIFVLGGFGKEKIAILLSQQENIGSLAVIGFFIISGFLITNSLFYVQSVRGYFIRRGLRLLPAFWVCLFVTAFGFAPFVYFNEHNNLQNFLSMPKGPIQYVLSNFFIFMHQYEIGNLLKHNPYPLTFDGSLWTLILEAKYYVLLGIFGIFGLIKKRRKVVLIFFILLYAMFLFNIHIPKYHNQLVHFFLDTTVIQFSTYFFSGVIFYLYKDKILFSNKLFCLSVIISIISIYFHMFHQIIPITFPYIIFCLAHMLPFQGLSKYGDFSYGVYIYAYPIQQLLTFYKLNNNILIYSFLTIAITMLFASLSWFFIEKPALSLKRYT